MHKSEKLKRAANELRKYAIACENVMNEEFDSRELLDEQVAYLNKLADDIEAYGRTAHSAEIVASQQKLLAALGGKPIFGVV